MNTGWLDMLHDAADPDLFPVAYRVDVKFDPVFQEEIQQNHVIRHQFPDLYDALFNLLLVDSDAHTLTAKYVTGSNQERVSNLFRYLGRFIF